MGSPRKGTETEKRNPSTKVFQLSEVILMMKNQDREQASEQRGRNTQVCDVLEIKGESVTWPKGMTICDKCHS